MDIVKTDRNQRLLTKSEKYYQKAEKLMPGGVNSPVRAFKSVKGSPVFFDKGEGCFLIDVDGNRYIDFCCSWGPLILGHAHPDVIRAINETAAKGTSFGAPTKLENELAELILNENPYIDLIRFVNSGTEAVMSAIRLARGATNRDLIIKFEGCYHGHVDHLLVSAGSGLATFGESSSAGVPESFTNCTLVLPLDDIDALKDTFSKYGDQIAAIIIEPLPANNGLLIQDRDFLQSLRDCCDESGALLIFDEVISGFRIGFNGMAADTDITPDILCYGKIIGGGMPVGAYAAKEHVMKHIAPEGQVYQAGTLSGNPVAMAAGIAQLNQCLNPGFYASQNRRCAYLVEKIMDHVKTEKYPVRIFSKGSIFWFSFSEDETVRIPDQITSQGVAKFNVFYHYLLSHGVYLGPSAYEVSFVSDAHSVEHLDEAISIFISALDHVYQEN